MVKENVYELHNPDTSATIRCTSTFLASWLARGFEVEKIIQSDNVNETLQEGFTNDSTSYE